LRSVGTGVGDIEPMQLQGASEKFDKIYPLSSLASGEDDWNLFLRGIVWPARLCQGSRSPAVFTGLDNVAA
jgi:hypothetical protein